jgi:hypothetical protein
MKKVGQSTQRRGISVLDDGGQRWDGNKFLLPPPPMAIDAPLMSQRQGSKKGS